MWQVVTGVAVYWLSDRLSQVLQYTSYLTGCHRCYSILAIWQVVTGVTVY